MSKISRATFLGGCCALPVLVGGGVIAAVGTALLGTTDDGSNEAMCSGSALNVNIDGDVPTVGGYSEQAMKNAAVIMQIGEQLKIPARGQLVALMTAMQESQLGDNPAAATPDSNGDAGVFQQRQLPGWYGTLEQVNDLSYAAEVFYKGKTLTDEVPGGAGPKGYHIPGLLDVSGWEGMAPTVAAQQVQRSAFPSAYAKHEDAARQIMSALSGVNVEIDSSTPGAATCESTGASDGGVAVPGDVAAVIEAARSTLGSPYVFGAGDWNGPNGPSGGQDCSGLTTFAYMQGAGQRLPRTARAQWAALRSTSVSPAEIQPGDLIFEAWGRLGAEVSHVTLYIGDGQAIEASISAGRTKISKARLSGHQFVGIGRVPKTFGKQ